MVSVKIRVRCEKLTKVYGRSRGHVKFDGKFYGCTEI